MTDPMTDHRGLEVLTLAECEALLRGRTVGRVAFVARGKPVVYPVNYRYDDGVVVFRTGLGDKLAAAAMGRAMALEIDDWDQETRTGWSVLASGTGEQVEAEEVAELRPPPDPWADTVPPTAYVRIRVSEVSGRRIARR